MGARKMKNLRHQACEAVWSWIAIVSIFGVSLIDAQVDQVQVDAIIAFKNGISVDPNNTLASWQGDDPCAFTGLTCGTIRATTTGASSDIIQIKLDGLNLTGTVSPALIGLTGLQVLYLSNNHFHGPIPDGLENLTNLRLVDVSNNNLNGTVPLGLAAKPGISLFVDGNPDLCDPRGLTECAVPSINSALPGVVPSSAKNGGDGLSGGAIFGIVLAVLILGGVAAGGAFYWVKVHRKKTRANLNFERFTGMGISDGDRL